MTLGNNFVVKSILNGANYFMPNNVSKNNRDFYIVYVFTITALVTILLAFIMAGVFFAANATKLSTTLLLAGWLGLVIAPFYKRFGSLSIFANLYNFGFFTALTYNIWQSHGLYSPGLPWLLFIPIYSLCFTKRLSVIFWTTAIVIEILLWGYLDYIGVKFSPEYNATSRTILSVFFPISLLVFLFILAKIYSYTTIESINHLHDHKDELVSNIETLTEEKEGFEKLAITDGLTGVYNRYFFDFRTVNEYKRIIRAKETMLVAMFDIDFFKKLNDQYGHGFGDQCLKTFAKTVNEHFYRPNDIFSRYGGEEFVVLLSDITEDDVKKLLEKIRQAVQNLVFVKNGQPVKMTVSIGAAIGRPKYKLKFDSILKQADDALYKAKSNGRNQVELVAFI